MGNKCIFSPPALLVVTPALVYWWVGVGDLKNPGMVGGPWVFYVFKHI